MVNETSKECLKNHVHAPSKKAGQCGIKGLYTTFAQLNVKIMFSARKFSALPLDFLSRLPLQKQSAHPGGYVHIVCGVEVLRRKNVRY